MIGNPPLCLPCLLCTALDKITLLELFCASANPRVFCAVDPQWISTCWEAFPGQSGNQAIKPTLAWHPPCSRNADRLHSIVLLSIVFHCNTQCAIVLHCSAHRKGWLVCAGNPLCLAIKKVGSLPCNTILFSQYNKKYCSASATINIVQPVQLKITPSDTVLFSNLLKYTLVGQVCLVHWNQGETKWVKTIMPGFLWREQGWHYQW